MDKRANQSKQSFNQGEIVIVSYPYSDYKGIKTRPAIIISNDVFNRSYQDIILVPLTSVIRREGVSVILNSDDLSSGKLLRTSVARIDKLASIDKKRIKAIVGKIKEPIINIILEKCHTTLTKKI